MKRRIVHNVIKDSDYTILAVDDAKDTLMLIEFDLTEEGFNVITADSGESALTLMEDTEVDLVLLDMYMPGISGLVTLEKIKSNAQLSNTPVIMLSASGDEDQIVAALELGADDYATKPYTPKILLARIRTSLRLKVKTLQLEAIARTDFLTKLNNRGSFEDLTNKAMSLAKRNNQPIVIAMFDIDFFKKVNDDYGHEGGDQSLIDFSQILLDNFRDYDILGRVGGEEFAVCMLHTQLEEAYIACERFRKRIEEHLVKIELGGELRLIDFTVSIGITIASGDKIQYKEMMRNADEALYKAKEMGRNRTMSSVDFDGDKNHELSSSTDVTTTEIYEEEVNVEVKLDSPTTESPENNLGSIMNEEEVSNGFPGIDYSVGVNNVLGDADLFEEILVMFYQDHGNDKTKMQSAIEQNDHSQLKHLVHTLKGVATSVGAMELFGLAKKLDFAVNDEQTESFPMLFAPLALELDKVVNGIQLKLSDKL